MARPTKEYRAFTRLVDSLLAVPRATIVERMAAYRAKAALKTRKPGPKPKSTRLSASERTESDA